MPNYHVTHLQTLGSFRITQSGRDLTIVRAKEKALVAFLCMNAGRAFSRDSLGNLLWSCASDDAKVRHSLNQAIYTINRAIPSLIRSENKVVQIRPECVATDIKRVVETIRRGQLLDHLDLIKGEFLADLITLDAPEFESWRSDYNRAFYHEVNAALQSELDAQPSFKRRSSVIELSSLPAAILPALKLKEHIQNRQTNGGEAPASDSVLLPSKAQFVLPFVGRSSQLARLETCWGQACNGRPQFVQISGHPGYGKTRLLTEFVSSINQQVNILLQARCFEAERRVSLGPILAALSDAVNEDDLANLEPIWQAALKEVIPSMPISMAVLPRLSPLGSQSRLFEAIIRTITLMSLRSPILIAIDDVQWLDQSTETLLSLLSHRLVGARVMVVLAGRRSLQGTPTERDCWTEVAVSEFNDPDFQDLTNALQNLQIGALPSVEEFRRITKGHPYLTSEVLRERANATSDALSGPYGSAAPSVDALIGSVLRELPKEVRVAAAVLAVIGRPARVTLVGQIARLRHLANYLDILVEQDLAYYSNGFVGLRHDLIRESVYKRIPIVTRSDFHRRAADCLATRGKRIDEIAEHYYHAGDQQKAYHFAILAANQAESRHAHSEAIYFLNLAVKAHPEMRVTLRPRLADLLYRSNRLQEARAEVSAILEEGKHSRAITSGWVFRDLELAYETAELSGIDLRAKLHELQQRLQEDDATLFEVWHLTARSAFHDGDRLTAARATEHLMRLGETLQSSQAIDARAVAAHVHATCVSSIQAEEWVASLYEMLNSDLEPEQRLRVRVALTATAYANGRLCQATAMAESALDEIEHVGAMNLWPINAAHLHMLYIEQGRFTEALALQETIGRRLANTSSDMLATVCANAAIMQYERGDYLQARQEAEFGLSSAVYRRSIWTDLILRGVEGLAALQLGDVARAAENADLGKQRIASLGSRMADLSSVEILIARVDVLRGQEREAWKRLEEAVKDYDELDLICRLRMQLEQARMLKRTDRDRARMIANDVYDIARPINAVLIAEKADALLLRL